MFNNESLDIVPWVVLGCLGCESQSAFGAGTAQIACLLVRRLENIGFGNCYRHPKFESVEISKVWVLGDVDKISDVVQC
jgi:hypothetical protein